ncbi:MAG: NUDIX hydrolase [Clostridiales Family XIII bacterium]|jgi:ADP-ribose pyrophosphatase|nr:NUDIX hydrolase [Clostridiales Family XIII bacterium]
MTVTHDSRGETHSNIGVFEEKTISSELIFDGAIIRVRKDTVEAREGKTAYREVVEHNGGVVVIAVTEDGDVPIVRQYRQAAGKVMLELPAGKLERINGEIEDRKEAAIRELKEETGYEATDIRWLTSHYATPGYCTEILTIYLATGLTKGEVSFDEHEALEPELIKLDTLYDMAIKGELDDAKTIVGVLMAHDILKN